MKNETTLDVVDQINDHLKSDQRPLTWLQGKTEIPYSTLYSIFVQRTFSLNQEKLDNINSVLGTKFKL